MTIVFGIIMLGVLVFVHELGHFLVAKASGGKSVEVFPWIWTKTDRQEVGGY